MTVLLRPLEPEDLEPLYQMENSMEDWEHSSNTVPFSHYLLRDYIATQKCDLAIDRQVRLVICDRNNPGLVMGLADLNDYNPIHRRAEIGIILAKEFRGRGYSLQAMRAFIGYIRSARLVDHVYAYVSEYNSACIRMLGKCGFIHGSTLKNWFVKEGKGINAEVFQLFLKKVR